MKQAFEASTNRESLNIVYHDIDWDELRSAYGAENIEEQLVLLEEAIPLLRTRCGHSG